MKIRINYDFFDKIKNAKENKPNVFTVIRNNKKLYLLDTLILNLFILWKKDLWAALAYLNAFLIGTVGIPYACLLIIDKLMNQNIYNADAKDKLLQLIKYLRELHLNTDYDLLLQTELYKKEYKLQHNSNGIPYILEKKYYNVPSYDYKNDIKTRSVLEEHALGSNRYELSIGEPKKKLKLAPITDYQ